MNDANDELLIRLLLANGLDECDDAVARIQTLKAERDAARDAALEKAAKAAESPDLLAFDRGWSTSQDAAALFTMMSVAAAIRALKGKSHE